MGQTAIPNPDSPATPVTSCPPSEFSMYGGADSISQLHASDARTTGNPPGGSGPIDVLGNDGALRL